MLANAQDPKPCRLTTTPECAALNAVWDAGTAAGNGDDWYRNRDDDHATIRRVDFPQLNDYDSTTSGYGYETQTLDAPRNILGNASLGYNGMWGMTRFRGMTSSSANAHYAQYRANQHYFHPAVRDVAASDEVSRDLSFAMFPYVTQSVGASGSEIDEINKFFHAMAAFKPAVKDLLEDNGLLIPAVQMIWRRTRVADDATYLSGIAHPSAFDNVDNGLEMVQMAQGMDVGNIPPLAMMEIEEETFGGAQIRRYREYYRSEQRFTTPCAISRIFYDIDLTKRMVVDLRSSLDVNDLDLTYHVKVLRGDPDKIRITPLNAEGSRVEIEIDHHGDFTVPGTVHPSSLVVIGVFVHNGHYYSPPSFITVQNLFNETRSYGANGLLQEIQYISEDINAEVSSSYAVSHSKSWDRDIFTHDFNGELAGWTREVSGTQTFYSRDGMLILDSLPDGRPAKVAETRYQSTYINTTRGTDTMVSTQYTDTDWQYEMQCDYQTLFTAMDTEVSGSVGDAGASMYTLTAPEHGQLIQSTGGVFRYQPESGFVGVDRFLIRTQNYTAQTTTTQEVKVVVGPADSTPPVKVTSLSVTGLAGDEAFVKWRHTSDDTGVARYDVYRDGQLVHQTTRSLSFLDSTVTPGETYTYTVVAVDDSGNQSAVSDAKEGGGAELWGQDDFEDGNYGSVDAALLNGMSWTLLGGAAAVSGGGNAIKVGTNQTELSQLVSNRSLAPPFIWSFNVNQQYVSTNQGVLFLYQDVDNNYLLVINRDKCELIRRVEGVDEVVGTSTLLKLQHQNSNADYRLNVQLAGEVLVFTVTKSNWSVSPDAVVSVTWTDADPAGVQALLAPGKFGFHQPTTGTWSVSSYDNLQISRLTGRGPDVDEDGLLDVWENLHFGSLEDPDASGAVDSDEDGYDNSAEERAGTDPKNAASRFYSISDAVGGSGLPFRWFSAPGRTYSLLATGDLLNPDWQPVAGFENLEATPPENTLHLDPAALGDFGYWKIRLDP